MDKPIRYYLDLLGQFIEAIFKGIGQMFTDALDAPLRDWIPALVIFAGICGVLLVLHLLNVLVEHLDHRRANREWAAQKKQERKKRKV